MKLANLTQDASPRTIEAEEFLSNRTSELLATDDLFARRTMNVVEIRDSFLMTPAVAGMSAQPASPTKPFWNPLKLVPAMLAVIGAAAGGITNLEVILDALQPSVSGKWQLTHSIETSNEPSGSMKSTFLFDLKQTGHKLKGQAEKIEDNNGKHSARREQMKLTGLVSGSDVILCYTEKSIPGQAVRQTLGCFNLKITRPVGMTRRASHMEGTFAADAPATGKVVAVRREE